MFSSIRKLLNEKLHLFFVTIVELIRSFAIFILNLCRPLPKILLKKQLASMGIEINGHNPWDIKVLDDRFYAVCIAGSGVGFHEAYRKDYFEVEDLKQFSLKLTSSENAKFVIFNHPYTKALGLINKYFDVQTKENAWKDGGEQYDFGIDLFKIACDPSLQISCLNFETCSIDQMEEAAYCSREVVAKKLKLRPKMTVLDIGCGFGALAKHLASKYDVSVTGITVSKDMSEYARDNCKKLDVKIMLKDYREIDGIYDRITCIEMMEHIGSHHIREFFEIVHKHLKDDGIFLLQVVSVVNEYGDYYEPSFDKFLGIRATFPNLSTVIEKANGLFVVEHLHNIGYDYGLTWSALFKNFQPKWPSVSHLYPKEQYKSGLLYLASGMAFKTRLMHEYQIVFAKKPAQSVYRF